MAMFNSFMNVYQRVKQVSSKPPLVVLWLSHIDGTPPLLEPPNAVAWTKGASCHRTSHKAWPNVGDRQWDAHGFLSNLWQLYLVGGIPTPLKNMSSSVGMIIPNWMEKQKSCSKPPTSIQLSKSAQLPKVFSKIDPPESATKSRVFCTFLEWISDPDDKSHST